MMRYFDLKNKWFIWPLFLFLLIYIILRAYFVAPLLDELGTFYWYIQTGKIIGSDAIPDANNHLINSFFSRGMYLLLGDHFFAFRTLSIASFILYFFSTKYFVQKNIDKSTAWLVFLALNMIPWISDYFSFSRGYASALACFFCSFCVLQNWLENRAAKHFLLLITLFLLTILSNLSMLIPVGLLFGYALLMTALNWKALKWKAIHLLIIAGFILSLYGIYLYAEALKTAGALWWGSRAGLWEITGKSLVLNVLFNNHDLWQLVLALILGIIGFTLIALWLRHKTRTFIQDPTFWTTALFFLALLAAVFMALFMKVNYPKDRVGMYLVPLFIVVLGLNFSKFKALKWSLLILLWFPASFMLKLNLNTSVFSPADRIQVSMYNRLKKELKPGDVLSGDYTSHIIYAYHERSNTTQRMGVDYFVDDTLTRGDYHLSWVHKLNWSNYQCIYQEPVSGTRLYKRISKPGRHILLDTVINLANSNALYVPVLAFNLKKYGNPRFIQTITSGGITLDKPSLEIDLLHATISSNNENRQLHATRFSWYFGHKHAYSFHFPNHVFEMKPNDTELLLFITNPELREVTLKNVRVRVYSIDLKS